MALYAPVRSGSPSLIASRGDVVPGAGAMRRSRSPAVSRPMLTSPKRGSVRPGDVTVPDPELLGIKPPLAALEDLGRSQGIDPADGLASHAPDPRAGRQARPTEPIGKTEQTDLNIDPAADHDQFSHFEPDSPGRGDGRQFRGRCPSHRRCRRREQAPKSRWRPAKSAGETPISPAPEPSARPAPRRGGSRTPKTRGRGSAGRLSDPRDHRGGAAPAEPSSAGMSGIRGSAELAREDAPALGDQGKVVVSASAGTGISSCDARAARRIGPGAFPAT